MGTWHPTITAYEVFGSRSESWDDKSPSVTVTLTVDRNDLDTFVEDTIVDRPVYPLEGPFKLNATRVNVLPVRSIYNGGGPDEEYIVPLNPVDVQVTYTNDPRFSMVLYDDPEESGSSGYQDVLLMEQVRIVTEFLTSDYNDFEWASSPNDPLTSADLAPGKLYRTYKVIQTWELVEITSAIETVLFDYAGTVNASTAGFYSFSRNFQAEQILFDVEDISPTVYKQSQMGEYDVQLYTIRLSYTAKSGEGNWNKFWRMKKNGAVDASGWDRIRHQRTNTDPNTPDAYLYDLTDKWSIFTYNIP